MGLATSLTYLGHREEALKYLVNAVDQVTVSQRPQLLTRIRVLARLFLTNATFQAYQDGLILFSSRKFKPSQEKFERALNEEADNVEVLLRMGQSTLLDGGFQNAIAHLKMAKQLDPFDPEIRLWLGKAFQSNGRSREALLELKEAYSSGRNIEASAVWYAEALASSGQIGAALKVLTQDSKANSSHLYSLLAAAKLRMQANRTESASWTLARKDLSLALKRLEQAQTFDSASSSQSQDNLAFIQDKSPEEIKDEILGYIKQIDQSRPIGILRRG
jgi:predicted Zn-dependent protease